jgi:hypothetical protein
LRQSSARVVFGYQIAAATNDPVARTSATTAKHMNILSATMGTHPWTVEKRRKIQGVVRALSARTTELMNS